MYSQVIEGRVTDPEALHALLDRWARSLTPDGWLGTTAGVTEDRAAIVIHRFSSATDAGAVSLLPTYDAWWQEVQAQFDGLLTIHDCADVEVYLEGGSDEAGFVQVVRSGIRDPHRHDELARELEATLPRHRPDLIGLTISRHDDGGATEVSYFRDPDRSRAGAAWTPPDELAATLAEWRELRIEPRVLDLTGPWLYTPEPTVSLDG